MSEQPSMQGRSPFHGRNPLLTGSLFLYRHAVSPILHATQQTLTGSTGACRFQPTCSEYASIAVHVHGTRRGGWLALLRFLRCHPFTRGGFDPVPELNRPNLAGTEIYPHRSSSSGPAPPERASHLP